ncbi:MULTISPECIES: DUF305 domain-containing protein [Nocardia]|uniref:DUF305 domain-containing protein n=1 Tax=Nocardia TaxID=1817 RepID=UPI0002F809A1|nr:MULTISPECIES: DUF305 domain-containing protein [Nocardia]
MFSTRNRIRSAVAVGAAVLTLLVAGCGSSMAGMDHGVTSSRNGPSSASAARTDFNDTDVTFLQMMYPHHAQAVDMARLVASRSQSQQLLTLASTVITAQGPEMQRISTLLQDFGKPAPTTGGHQMTDMPGMMPSADMTALEGLSGPDFDRTWLRMMIDHHTGAITMANTEITGGANPDAKALAHDIVSAQQAEIDQMRAILGGR